MRKIACLSLLLLLFTTTLATSQETDQGVMDDDARKVEKKIRDKKKVNIRDLKVLHKGDTIYLEGVADLYGSRYYAEKEALEVEGVKKVDNQIAVSTEKVQDIDIETRATEKIRSHMRGTPFDLISVEVKEGFVTLAGSVRDQTLVKDALESVIWLKGVRDVQNKIELTSISAGDERLRAVIFARLNREFPQYFVGRFPSILIIVNNARVTLVGNVESNASREKTGSIVRSINGVLSVDNQLQAK
jgi:osmotically-inducible protein OsmY